jgi:hypothetical protein
MPTAPATSREAGDHEREQLRGGVVVNAYPDCAARPRDPAIGTFVGSAAVSECAPPRRESALRGESSPQSTTEYP